MVSSANRFGLAVLAGLAWLGGAASSAHAQVRVPPFNPFVAQGLFNAAATARINQNAFGPPGRAPRKRGKLMYIGIGTIILIVIIVLVVLMLRRR